MILSGFLGILALVLLGVILGLLWRLVRSPLPLQMQQALEAKEDAKLKVLKDEWTKRLGEEVTRVWSQMQAQVHTTEKTVSDKLQQANTTLAHVTQELGRLQEATRKVEEVGRDVTSLQDLLRAPKLRGGLGEYFLADLLRQVIPADCFVLQYEFSDGQRVDAAIRLRDRLVPVDSKFPLEQFRKLAGAATESERQECRKQLLRDVRGHIDTIAEKYIRPSEGTFDFALMYIPAENVYYETVIREEPGEDGPSIFQHAVGRQVIPVSPNSFYAYLQVIVLGLRGLMVEHRAQEILEALKKLQKDLGVVRENFDLAGKQLRYTLVNFDKAERSLVRFEDRLGVAVEAPAVPGQAEVLSAPGGASIGGDPQND